MLGAKIIDTGSDYHKDVENALQLHQTRPPLRLAVVNLPFQAVGTWIKLVARPAFVDSSHPDATGLV